MSVADLEVDLDRAVARLMRFLAVEGITGQEKAIAAEVARHLREAGVPPGSVKYDTANERIPLPTETGNLIVSLPGTRPGPRLLFATHLDTVPLCAGAVPVRVGKDRVKAQGETALGGDNRTGVACLVNLAGCLLERNLPHPPITLLFTVREESGLFGARYLDPADLGEPVMGFNVDGKSPTELTIGAVGAERWEVEIAGRASHAGVHPEQGISATMVGALALADVKRGGWFGKVRKDGREGTSNVGSFGGRDGLSAGEATNVVTDYVHIRGESRSHDPRFFRMITRAYRDAFDKAATKVTDDKGRPARVRFTSRLDYHPFKLRAEAPVVKRAQAAARLLGMEATTRVGNGGLDANWLVKHKVPTVTFGAGQNNIHTLDEYVDLQRFLDGCRLALALATMEA
jgi:tripeptide aminopeptidase